MNAEKKFYESTWFCIVMLIAICPVGVFLIWRNKKFNKIIRIAITIIAAPLTLFVIMFLYFISSDNQDIDSRKTYNKTESSQKDSKEDKVNEKESKGDKKEDLEAQGNNEEKSKSPKDSDTIDSFVKMCSNSQEVYFTDLMRNPDKYTGKTYLVKGVVNQVMDTDEGWIQLKIYDDMTEDEMILIYDRNDGEQRFLENDYIYAIIDFTGIQSIEMLSGQKKSFPIGEVKKIELGEVAQAMIAINSEVKRLGYNYKLIYDSSVYIGQGIGGTCYLFRVYDVDNKCYKTEYIACYGYNLYWYNKETLELSQQMNV